MRTDTIKADNLACPLDGEPLSGNGSLRCSNGHSFDVARQGYIHLLPVQNKKSKEPGDSKAMVEARGRFLDAGIYQPISDMVNRTVSSYLSATLLPCVVDAGCGEGYYLQRLQQALQQRQRSASLIGLDISKPAVMAATRRSKDITWLVASNNNPAVQSQSVDMILCMFGFPLYDAFKTTLKAEGKLILVDAGENHLIELRKIIYPEVRKTVPNSLDRAAQEGFSLLASEALTYQTGQLDRQLIADLLLMTPHLFRATHAGKEAVARIEQLNVTVDVVIRVLNCK